nr:SDR family oxidoreductase [uncultured Mucilaginibacter sp.]
MKVLVFGASGKTGRLVVERAVAMGHEVSVLVRQPGSSAQPGVRVITGDALKPDDVLRAMGQQDAVVGCIGGTKPWKSQTLERDAMQNIVKAMKTSGAKRLVVVSAMGVGDSKKQSPWWYRNLMLPTFLRGSTADKTAMEAIVQGSGLDWIIARPPILKDGTATGKVEVLGQSGTGHGITRADLAVWLVDQLANEAYMRQAVVVVNN